MFNGLETMHFGCFYLPWAFIICTCIVSKLFENTLLYHPHCVKPQKYSKNVQQQSLCLSKLFRLAFQCLLMLEEKGNFGFSLRFTVIITQTMCFEKFLNATRANENNFWMKNRKKDEQSLSICSNVMDSWILNWCTVTSPSYQSIMFWNVINTNCNRWPGVSHNHHIAFVEFLKWNREKKRNFIWNFHPNRPC